MGENEEKKNEKKQQQYKESSFEILEDCQN